MKVALFHTTLPEVGRKPGGVEMVVHRLANALAQSGEVDVKVYSLSSLPTGGRYRHQRLYARLPWLKNNQFGRLIVLPVLLNFVHFEPADVMHFHGDDWFFVRRKVPTVRTLHGSALFEARAARSWKRKVEQYAVYPLEQLAARLCRVAIGIGAETAKLYRTKYTMDNGVDTGLFRPGAKAEYPQVLYVGTWNGRKRGKFLFDLFVRDVLPAFPRARLCMVSDLCPEHPSVSFRRFPPDEELAQYFRESWVFAYPSVYEGFGIAYVEALASGTAVLTSPNQGAAHVLDNGKYGVIAEDSVFGGRLRELLDSAAIRQRFEQAGPARAKAFSWNSVVARHQAIYREAIQS